MSTKNNCNLAALTLLENAFCIKSAEVHEVVKKMDMHLDLVN